MAKVIYSPAECHAGCTERDCPYQHREAWFVWHDNQEFGPFESETLARSTAARMTAESYADERAAEAALSPTRKATPMRWISEGDELPKVGQRVLLCAPRQHAEFWDMSVMCLMVDYDGVVPLPVPAGSQWPTRYFWGDPYYGRQHFRLITGNAWWSTLEGIALPPRAMHRYMGPRNDHVILQDGDVWIGQNEPR